VIEEEAGFETIIFSVKVIVLWFTFLWSFLLILLASSVLDTVKNEAAKKRNAEQRQNDEVSNMIHNNFCYPILRVCTIHVDLPCLS
jgi:F420-0:gamma-glutamyl ligase-like protein